MKQSNSAFEILSRSDNNLSSEADVEEEAQKVELLNNERPKTSEYVAYIF